MLEQLQNFTSHEDVKHYIETLIDYNLMYHFDSCVSQCFSDPDIVEKLTIEQDRLWTYCDEYNICPFDTFFKIIHTDQERCFKMYGSYEDPNY